MFEIGDLVRVKEEFLKDSPDGRKDEWHSNWRTAILKITSIKKDGYINLICIKNFHKSNIGATVGGYPREFKNCSQSQIQW